MYLSLINTSRMGGVGGGRGKIILPTIVSSKQRGKGHWSDLPICHRKHSIGCFVGYFPVAYLLLLQPNPFSSFSILAMCSRGRGYDSYGLPSPDSIIFWLLVRFWRQQ